MKTIRIKFVDFFDGFDKNNNEFFDVLKERFEVAPLCIQCIPHFHPNPIYPNKRYS